eukprot:Sspe_Gene.73431::Locus_44322_Transcript_1_1_Confidence_1.000_Length_1669::g.73431::m.73431
MANSTAPPSPPPDSGGSEGSGMLPEAIAAVIIAALAIVAFIIYYLKTRRASVADKSGHLLDQMRDVETMEMGEPAAVPNTSIQTTVPTTNESVASPAGPSVHPQKYMIGRRVLVPRDESPNKVPAHVTFFNPNTGTYIVEYEGYRGQHSGELPENALEPAPPRFRVGDRVLARWMGTGRDEIGTVTDVHNNGTYTVVFDDEACDPNEPDGFMSLMRAYAPGDRVFARKGGSRALAEPATVLAKNANGTYRVQFDSGETRDDEKDTWMLPMSPHEPALDPGTHRTSSTLSNRSPLSPVSGCRSSGEIALPTVSSGDYVLAKRSDSDVGQFGRVVSFNGGKLGIQFEDGRKVEGVDPECVMKLKKANGDPVTPTMPLSRRRSKRGSLPVERSPLRISRKTIRQDPVDTRAVEALLNFKSAAVAVSRI